MQDVFRRQAQFLRTIKPLEREEERALIATAQSAENKGARDTAAQRIVLAHMPLATRMSWKAAKGNHDSFEDYLNVSVIAMYHAIEKFDLTFESRFSTYSSRWIDEAIKGYRHDELHILNVPGGQRPQKIMRHMLELQKTQEFGGSRSDHEKMTRVIAQRTGFEVDSVKNYIAAMAPAISLETPIPGIEDGTLGQTIPSNEPGADELIEKEGENAHFKAMLSRALDKAGLNDREKEIVLGRRMVPDGDDVPTLDAFSLRYNLSRERVRQIEAKGMDKLRAVFTRMGIGSMEQLVSMSLPPAAEPAHEEGTHDKTPSLAAQVSEKLAAEKRARVPRRLSAPV